MSRFSTIAALCLSLPLIAPAADPFRDTVRPFLAKNCVSCHGLKEPAAGLNLAALVAKSDSLRDRARWESISRRVRLGEMPPKGAPRPDLAQSASVTKWIDDTYARLDKTNPADPGRVTARRLNRFEYSNSVRDLLGIDMLPAEDLPADTYGYGFDNIGDVLSVNSAWTERYLKAAERIARAAIPTDADVPPPVMRRYMAERIGQDRQLHMTVDHAFPADGEYDLRAGFFQGLSNNTRALMKLFVDGREVGTRLIVVDYQIDRGIEAHGVPVTAGRHRVEATIEVLPESKYKGPPPYLEHLQVYGPMKVVPAATSAAYGRFFSCRHAPGAHTKSCSRQILAPLAREAWRRPVSAVEMDGLLTLVGREQSRTGSFELAMRAGVEAVLVSPHFLFRVERDHGSGVRQLDSYELAARLSYFLWGSLPDAELSKLADEGKVALNLRAQAVRMLADPKSQRFVESFAGQWLQLRNLSIVQPDAKLFPAFNGELAGDMRTESEMFFAAMLKENRPLPEFLDAKFTFLNDWLAKHYGIAGIEGPEFRQVELQGGQRGGILGHASVLTVSSYPTRTSPVIRGKWVLENLLNQPPPPPPPNVPPLEEKPGPAAGTMRQRLEAHRANAVCAGCHSRMDPLGFGLENYDAIGRWREQEGGAPVDASGVLPNGAKFGSPAELKSILVGQKDVFVDALSEKILTYATGRGMEARDRAAVKKLADHVRENGYRFQALILGAVESDAFRLRGAVRTETK